MREGRLERLLQLGPAWSGRWTTVIPMLDPRRAGLTIRRGSGRRPANAASRSAAAARVRQVVGTGQDLERDDRHLERASQALEEDLVHAQRGGGDARAGVGQRRPIRTAPGACRPRRTGRATRSRRPAAVRVPRASPAPRRRTSVPARRRSRGRSKSAAGRSSASAAIGSCHQAPSSPMSQGSTCAPSAASASAMARPETIETSCSADGPPSRTTIGGRPAAERGDVSSPRLASSRSCVASPARPVTGEDDLEAQSDARLLEHGRLHRLCQAAHVGRPCPAGR